MLERMLAALMDACGSKSASISRLLSSSDGIEWRGPGEDGLRGEAGRTTPAPTAGDDVLRLAMPKGDSARSGLLTPSPRANRPCMPARSIKDDPSGEDGLRAEEVCAARQNRT